MAVNSSINEASWNLFSFNEVRTIKHKPNNVEEAFSICGKLLLLLSILRLNPGYDRLIGWRRFGRNDFLKFAVFVQQVLLEIPFDF